MEPDGNTAAEREYAHKTAIAEEQWEQSLSWARNNLGYMDYETFESAIKHLSIENMRNITHSLRTRDSAALGAMLFELCIDELAKWKEENT
jgi:hypothetical protein